MKLHLQEAAGAQAGGGAAIGRQRVQAGARRVLALGGRALRVGAHVEGRARRADALQGQNMGHSRISQMKQI